MPRYADWPLWLKVLIVGPHALLLFVLAYLLYPRSDEGRGAFLFLTLDLIAFYLVMHFAFHFSFS
jgi:hypothetical protein